MSGPRLELGPAKEPLGMVRGLQWFFSIFAFATCGGYGGNVSFRISCNGQSNATVTASFAYPFRLNQAVFTPSLTHLCNNTWREDVHLVGDFSSSAQFFVTVAVLAFLYSMVALGVYLGYLHLYRGAGGKLPLLVSPAWSSSPHRGLHQSILIFFIPPPWSSSLHHGLHPSLLVFIHPPVVVFIHLFWSSSSPPSWSSSSPPSWSSSSPPSWSSSSPPSWSSSISSNLLHPSVLVFSIHPGLHPSIKPGLLAPTQIFSSHFSTLVFSIHPSILVFSIHPPIHPPVQVFSIPPPVHQGLLHPSIYPSRSSPST
ncbi:PREDICTED: uncharacterized protein LOC106893651 [Calidris pugnax]|uniref:uncharacterized protein LOC106893651 n=1 Tax=Calidris pugnax TaxID=198806 RepID=UPI00071D1753|nr:PREDICTED: uncharacterized protein LOC106893651 [Calidris pugnax]